MKKIIFLELLRYIHDKPKLIKKVKIFVIAGIAFVIIASVALIWVGFSVVNVASSKIQEIDFQKHAGSIETRASGCWTATQRLLSITNWASISPTENFKDLVTACTQENVTKSESEQRI